MLSWNTFIVTYGTVEQNTAVLTLQNTIGNSRPKFFVGDWGYLQEYQDNYGHSGRRVQAQVPDQNGHHFWTNEWVTALLPVSHACWFIPDFPDCGLPPLVLGGGGATNINICGYIFYKHLCITSRTSPLPCGRVGETTKLGATWSQHTLKYPAVSGTGYSHLAIPPQKKINKYVNM